MIWAGAIVGPVVPLVFSTDVWLINSRWSGATDIQQCDRYKCHRLIARRRVFGATYPNRSDRLVRRGELFRQSYRTSASEKQVIK